MEEKKKEPKPQIINRVTFGDYIAEKRRNAGFKNRESFSEAIKEKTSLIVSSETIKRIERGDGLPNLETFLAIATTLESTVGISDSWWDFVTDSLTSNMDGHLELLQIQGAIGGAFQGLELDKSFYGSKDNGWITEGYSPEQYLSFALKNTANTIACIQSDLNRVSTFTAEDEKLKLNLIEGFDEYKKSSEEHIQWVKFISRAKPAQ